MHYIMDFRKFLKNGTFKIIRSFIQYSVWRQVQSLLQNDASI